MSKKENTKNNRLNVAIIGAGVSGLYAGWRLVADKKMDKVAIFEMSNRIGGRLHTVQNFGETNMPAELGGMRYMKHQELTASLVKELDLETTGFPMGEKKEHLFYLRRTQFKVKEWGKDQQTPFYKVSAYGRDENGKLLDADGIFEKITKEILDANNVKRPENREGWDKIKSTLRCHRGADEGRLLKDIGFWNLIQELADSESYELASQAGGYFSNTINWNAAEALPYVVGDFGGDTEYLTLKAGFDAIASELGKVFEDAGGAIHLNHQLLSFDIQNDATYKYKLTFTENGVEKHVYAKHLIFGMPRRSLELIQWPKKLSANSTFRKQVRAVIGEPSFKLLMAFHHPNDAKPWWERKFGLEYGRGITDLPMRQCYYFGTNKEKRRSIILASFNDMRTVSFWKPLEDPHNHLLEFSPLNGKASTDSQTSDDVELFEPDWEVLGDDMRSLLEDVPRPPKYMVEHALAQLKEVHQLDEIPQPYYAAFRNWNHEPYGGGYHAWKARFKVGEVMKKMRKPFETESIHIVGEAYSDQQAWVEGAFCITELMLEENFGLRRPAWLRGDYYLGR